LEGGSWNHVFGTDTLGRDYLARIVFGARVALLVGFGAASISCLIGTLLGVSAGYFGGYIDRTVSFIITARLAIPIILVALAVVAVAGSSLMIVISVLGLLLWDRFALVLRSATMQLRGMEFVTASQLQGASVVQVIWYDILPNIFPQLVIVYTLEVAQAIVLEAALSFLGLGVPPPTPSWASMIADGKASIFFNDWLITIPGTALFLLVITINLCGDALRTFVLREDASK
jgi:peptide/nickel transport system permease protein